MDRNTDVFDIDGLISTFRELADKAKSGDVKAENDVVELESSMSLLLNFVSDMTALELRRDRNRVIMNDADFAKADRDLKTSECNLCGVATKRIDLINGILARNSKPPVFTGDTTDTNQIKDFCMELCKKIYSMR